MNLLTDLGVLSGGHDLARRIDEGSLKTPAEVGGGSSLFVWQGRADAVELVTWMPRFLPPPPFSRLGGSDIWVLFLPVPATAMFEYRIRVHRAGRHTDHLDRLNPEVTTNPFGVNSVATGPRYVRPAWSLPHSDHRPGTVSELRVQSSVWGERRHHLLYLPPNHSSDTEYPVVVFHDGSDFLHHSALGDVLDNLIGGGLIPPVVGILHDPRHRLDEYNADERHDAHVLEELIPHVEKRVAIAPRPSVLGSSLGAVASMALAWRNPSEVAGIALLSGSFATSVNPDRPPDVFGPVVALVEEVGADRRLAHHRAYVSCGRYEGLVDLNRAFVPKLRAAGLSVAYEETWEGHQWASWRDRLGPALIHVLG